MTSRRYVRGEHQDCRRCIALAGVITRVERGTLSIVLQLEDHLNGRSRSTARQIKQVPKLGCLIRRHTVAPTVASLWSLGTQTLAPLSKTATTWSVRPLVSTVTTIR